MAGEALGKALATHDQAALEKLPSPQMIVNDPSNTVLTRAEIFQGLLDGQLDYEVGPKSRRWRSVATSPSSCATTKTYTATSLFIPTLPTVQSDISLKHGVAKV
jgi:hypothetical protein